MVWTVIFLDLLGFGIVIPSLAYFVKLFPVPEVAMALGAKLGIADPAALFVGAIQTSYSLFQFVCAPLWGGLSDRIGRKPVLVMTMLGFTGAWLLFAFAPSLWFLMISRALSGAFGANVATAQAYIGDVYPPDQRAKGMGLIGMAFGLGFVFGPALGALLSSDLLLSQWFSGAELERGRILVPGLFAAGASFLAFGVGLLLMPESLPPSLRNSKRGPQDNRILALLKGLRRPKLGALLLVYFSVVFGFASLESMFSQFNLDRLKLPQSANGWVFTAIGVVLAVVQGGLIGPLTRRFGSRSVLSFGLLGLALLLGGFGFHTQLNPGFGVLTWLVIWSMANSACFSLCNPSVLGLVSELTDPSTRGETMGLTASAATLGRILGPLLAGAIYVRAGPQWPFVAGGVSVAAAWVLLRRVGR